MKSDKTYILYVQYGSLQKNSKEEIEGCTDGLKAKHIKDECVATNVGFITKESLDASKDGKILLASDPSTELSAPADKSAEKIYIVCEVDNMNYPDMLAKCIAGAGFTNVAKISLVACFGAIGLGAEKSHMENLAKSLHDHGLYPLIVGYEKAMMVYGKWLKDKADADASGKFEKKQLKHKIPTEGVGAAQFGKKLYGVTGNRFEFRNAPNTKQTDKTIGESTKHYCLYDGAKAKFMYDKEAVEAAKAKSV